MRLPIRKLSIRALTTTGKLLVVLGISLLLAGVSFAYSVLENDKSGQSGQDNTGGLTLREGSEAVATDEADKVEDSDEEDKDKTKAKDENKQAEQPKDSNPDNSGDDEQPATCVGGQHTPGGPDGMGGCWPGPHNTGVPAGTTLSNYTGTCSLRTDNQIIDSKLINNCSGGMHIYASNVTIRNTKINGPINTNSGGSLTIIDSEVNGGSVHSQALGVNNLTALRVNVYGNQHAIHCNSNCDIRDSWMHDQYDGSSMGWHQNGYITNGGSNIILKHNTADCVGACTADIALLN